MKLISLGAITPQGATLKEHVEAEAKFLEQKKDFIEYFIGGEKRKIAVQRAQESKALLPVPDGVLRRMGLSTKMVLSCIEEAKSRVKINAEGERVGLIVVTTQGPSSTNIEYFKKLVSFNYRGASPNLFAQSVHNNIASTVALTHQWKGPTLTLVQEENLWSALMNISQLWLQQKTVDKLWIILGNEVSLHVPYIQLYEHVKENPETLEFYPKPNDRAYEAYSCFLLGSDGVADFNFKNTTSILQKLEKEKDRPLIKPEHIGVALAEHFYKEYFSKT